MSTARRRTVLGAAMAGMFMAAVESTIVATALPSIVADLGGFHLFSWVFAVYLLAQAVTIPIYGRLADLHGRKRVFAAGTLLFLVGSGLCGFARNMVMLIAFRALQGLGAGAIVPITTTVVGDIYPGASRARAQGYLSGVWGIAAVSGPLLGAFLVERVTWAAVFWVNLPVGAVCLALFAFALRESPHHQRRSIDYLGAALMMTGSGALMLALIQWAHLSDALRVALPALAVAALVAFAFSERRSAEPMMPLDLWRIPAVAASNIAAFALGGSLIGVTAFVPTYVQGVMGRGAVTAGFALTAMSLSWSLTTILMGHLTIVARSSYRALAVCGGGALVAGSAILILLDPARGPLWAASGALVIGIGMGLCNTTYIVAAQDSVEFHRRGTATSVNVFLRMVGQSVAAAIFGGILNSVLAARIGAADTMVDRLMTPALRAALPAVDFARLDNALAAGLHGVFWATGAFSLLALLLALRLPKGLGSRHARE
ncbi:MAG TPA: MDR family MFS transporter [Stellaceae bacterium]|nr:MDR family MFS transporter [Stellaceae bacterium]